MCIAHQTVESGGTTPNCSTLSVNCCQIRSQRGPLNKTLSPELHSKDIVSKSFVITHLHKRKKYLLKKQFLCKTHFEFWKYETLNSTKKPHEWIAKWAQRGNKFTYRTFVNKLRLQLSCIIPEDLCVIASPNYKLVSSFLISKPLLQILLPGYKHLNVSRWMKS